MLFEDLELRRAEVERHEENSARLAQAFAKFETTGQGTLEFSKRVDFELTFIEEPYVAYGCQIGMEELGDLLGASIKLTPPLPLASGFVTEWDIDERGFYTGCWCAVSVHFAPAAGTALEIADTELALAKVTMRHHFTFTAVGMKDVPIDVRD